ncbi:MAG: NrfD/PsrC family molybdoenzyme membrane anchor subunit, partial [Solirubrobacteraceae bacterium]
MSATQTVPARSYYGRPILKEPVWEWEIPTYFFTGGLAGASATLGLIADVAGNEQLARSAWSAAVAGIAVSPALLVSDLGRPECFLNMLRVVKVTSPMSVGSWILVAASGAFTASFA